MYADRCLLLIGLACLPSPTAPLPPPPIDEFGEDGNSYGFPSTQAVMNLSNAPDGYSLNTSSTGDGLVGGYLPIAHYVFPLNPNTQEGGGKGAGGGARKGEQVSWDMIAVASPTANNSRVRNTTTHNSSTCLAGCSNRPWLALLRVTCLNYGAVFFSQLNILPPPPPNFILIFVKSSVCHTVI